MSDLFPELTDPTLCSPDREKSCFSCCPPIRPPGYEHVQHRNIVRRILRENSEAFKKHEEYIIPITGFSCWALGFLDENHKLVGCLLHPAQNGGVDLRYRIDYGEKCEREFCPEAKVFSGLELREKKFWLHLADGLDSFAYSSRKLNPLFRMMNWGGYLLSLVSSNEDYRAFKRKAFFQSYPFFLNTNLSKAHVYLAKWLVKREGTRILQSKTFPSKFLSYSTRLSQRARQALTRNLPLPPFTPTHLLDLDRDFLDFVRLSARITKINSEDALCLKKMVDDELEAFRQGIQGI